MGVAPNGYRAAPSITRFNPPHRPGAPYPDSMEDAWRAWLEHNHSSDAGIWLKFAKKGTPTKTVTYGEALEEALCYGWIDGQARGYDEAFYLQRFTPRRRRSMLRVSCRRCFLHPPNLKAPTNRRKK